MDAKVLDSDIINASHGVMRKNDAELRALLDRVNTSTQELENTNYTTDYKYKQVVSIEFLLFRARILVETEHINIKSIVSDSTVPLTIKSAFIKRDQYLAQVSAKLTTIANDISILEKSVYAEQTIFKH